MRLVRLPKTNLVLLKIGEGRHHVLQIKRPSESSLFLLVMQIYSCYCN